MLKRYTALKRSLKPLKKTRIPRVSQKRKREMVEYAKKRKAFLEAHPWCQVWLTENGVDENKVAPHGVAYVQHPDIRWVSLPRPVPRSTEIHHRAGRGKNYLNEATWLAVSSEMHRRIHENPSWARAKGYLK